MWAPASTTPLTSRHTTSSSSLEPPGAPNLHWKTRTGDRCNQCGSHATNWALQDSLPLLTVSHHTGLVPQHLIPRGNDSPLPTSYLAIIPPPSRFRCQSDQHLTRSPNKAGPTCLRTQYSAAAARAAQPTIALVPSSYGTPPGHSAPNSGL
ncbi:hypothetical protein NDU88_002437 [Pleurodeles waltl]|uniref:Uncharacterized protein n=1 Tax=Pleurodeles waltl TaxID=8319 RepID=A0AAV7SCG4_PLEWA|nr:hypothetical protein NDU88_002437 [Pleurodeles waltl]